MKIADTSFKKWDTRSSENLQIWNIEVTILNNIRVVTGDNLYEGSEFIVVYMIANINTGRTNFNHSKHSNIRNSEKQMWCLNLPRLIQCIMIWIKTVQTMSRVIVILFSLLKEATSFLKKIKVSQHVRNKWYALGVYIYFSRHFIANIASLVRTERKQSFRY